MQLNQLRPASQLAQRFGVKALAYGGPGTGKTPMINTAPRPVLCVVEPGMLSMRTSNVPAWEAYDCGKIDEFFKWLFRQFFHMLSPCAKLKLYTYKLPREQIS
mgnify:CR=1 FL=1